MNTAQPIKDLKDLEHFKHYYVDVEPNMRNYVLLTLGLNTALRISDLLSLRWKDVYDFSRGQICSHISLVEGKTHKKTSIYVNKNIYQALLSYKDYLECESGILPEQYLFCGQYGNGNPISRSQAWRIIKKDAEYNHISGVISPHSLRKTFGYHAWKHGVSPAMLMEVFNHSSFYITKRYLGIGQDDRDKVFRDVCI